MNNAQAHEDLSHNDLHVLDIFNEMRRVGLESTFIFALMENCQRYEGIRNLLVMWFEENNTEEKSKIVADLQEILDDIKDIPRTSEERPYLHFDDLSSIKRDILKFKNRLREETDRQGGISELSRRTEIPQPSLSRFFNSNSMPRRTTLYKIAKALNLPESVVGFKWTR